jgi:hypothetical protein
MKIGKQFGKTFEMMKVLCFLISMTGFNGQYIKDKDDADDFNDDSGSSVQNL